MIADRAHPTAALGESAPRSSRRVPLGRSRMVLAAGLAILVAAVLILSVPLWTVPVRANTGCPGTQNSFGSQSLSGDCTITSNTSWGNGTLSLAGNLIVASGARLTLWNLNLQFNPSVDQQYMISVAGGAVVVRGGTLTSANPSHGWRLETSTDASALVDMNNVNVSYAGSGSYSGFLFQGGNGHRLRHLKISNSALGSSDGVLDIEGSISDLRVENSTFTNTGTAFYVGRCSPGANLVFWGNTVSSFGATNGGPAVYAQEAQVVNNAIDVGSGTGIEVSGGGPGYPAQNAYRVSGNSVTTTGNAIVTSGSSGWDILFNHVYNGHVSLDGSGNRFAYNNVTGTDERATPGEHVMWTSSNSSIDHNTFWNIGLTQDSVILTYLNYGNIKITDNTIYAGCYGNNCMGIETINVQSDQRTIFPGFPTVEVARNRQVWTTIVSGGLTAAWDNEFSDREWIHDNVEQMLSDAVPGTSSIEVGGARYGVFENNTILGPTTWCIYEYIYSDAGNLFQNNRCDNAHYGGIFQTGGNVYRNNVFTNLQKAGIWICPNSPCAGSNTNTLNNAWYNNTFTFAQGATPYLTDMDVSNAFDNSFIGHGSNQWWDGSSTQTFPGDWLFWANGPITHLAWADGPGSRTLTMTSNGQRYWDQEPASGVTDTASIAVDGAIDYHGSSGGQTALTSLDPKGTSSLVVTGTGLTTFSLSGFWASSTCAISVDNLATGVTSSLSLVTDTTGSGQFSVPFGATPTQFSISIASSGGTTPPPPAPTPPSVTTGAPTSVGSSSATLNAQLTSLGSASSATVGFLYSTDPGLAGATNATVGTETTAGSFTKSVSGLAASTTYYVAAWVQGTSFVSGSIKSFATSAPPSSPSAPSVTTGAASSVTATMAMLGGSLDQLGTASSVTVGFLYGTASDLSAATNTTVGPLASPGAFSLPVNGLSSSTTYYVQAWGSGQGFAAGGVVSFTTAAAPVPPPPPAAPAVSTLGPAKIASSWAMLQGSLTSPGSASSVVVGFEYATNPSFSGAVNVTVGSLASARSFAATVSGLTARTTYYYAAWASGQGFSLGHVVMFTTTPARRPPPHPQLGWSGSGSLILTATYDPAVRQLHVLFTAPMNQSSVAASLSLGPAVPFQLAWQDSAHLVVEILSPIQDGARYSLTIGPTAMSSTGRSLGTAFTFTFGSTFNLDWGSVAYLAAGTASAAALTGFLLLVRFRRRRSA